jgi:shikimate dehydrogenase
LGVICRFIHLIRGELTHFIIISVRQDILNLTAKSEEMEKINGKTTICAVFGDPVAHSFSPAIHNAAFQALGMNCVYIACHVRADRLQDAVQAIRSLDLKGANVTIPHKQTVAAYLDELCGDARQSGSVNTIVNRGDRLLGYSTDGLGFVRSLKEDAGYEPAGKNLLMLGAGGSAAALIYRLIGSGIASLTLINRNFSRAVNLQERVWLDTRFEIRVKGLEELEACDLQTADLLINTTSVGIHDDVSLIPRNFLHPDLFVYDIVYKRGGTTLVNEAKAAGCRVLTGLSLLLYQGAESFRLWFETEPPIAAMREALERMLG